MQLSEGHTPAVSAMCFCAYDPVRGFDPTVGYWQTSSQVLDIRYVPATTTTHAPPTVFRCPPPKCVRRDERRAR